MCTLGVPLELKFSEDGGYYSTLVFAFFFETDEEAVLAERPPLEAVKL